MKKSLSIILICVAFVTGIVVGALGFYAIGEIRHEIREEAIENKYELNRNDKGQNVAPQDGKNENNAPAPALQDTNGSAVQDEYIGEEKAKEIALADAGFTAQDVSYIHAKLEYEDDYGIYKYDVSFRIDRTEYEYEIDAVNGSVITFDKDFDD